MDGLPTLKVQTLTQDIAVEHRRCHTSPVPLEPGKLQPQHRHMKEAKQPLTLPRINYAQILLEEEEDEYSDEIVLKRVLIWRPGQRKAHSILKGHSTGVAYDERHPPSLYTTSHEYECEPSSVRKGEPSTYVLKTEQPHAIAVGTDKPSDTVKEGTCTGDRGPIPHESTRSSLKVYKTNLTDTLPPEEGHKVTIKVGKCTWYTYTVHKPHLSRSLFVRPVLLCKPHATIEIQASQTRLALFPGLPLYAPRNKKAWYINLSPWLMSQIVISMGPVHLHPPPF